MRTKVKKHALLVAADTYEDEGLQQLRAPSGDVKALAEVLADPDIGGFEVHDTLVNRPKQEVCNEIDDFFDAARSNDLLLLYLSCHGVLKRRSLYFAATDTNLKRLPSSAISEGYVNEVMQHSRSNRIVLILDCCHSGAFAKNVKSNREVHVGDRFEARGRVTMSASSELEYALDEEAPQDLGSHEPGSLFTRYLVQGLKSGEADEDHDGEISVGELYEYVLERVQAKTPDQTPELSGQMRGDLVIAHSPRALAALLPSSVQDAIDNPFANIRLGGAHELVRLMKSRTAGVARAAEQALRSMLDDDSRSVASTAATALGMSGPATPPAPPAAQPPPVAESPAVVPPSKPQAKPEPEAPPAPPPKAPASPLIERARKQFDARRYETAEELFREALAESPDSVDALVGRASALERLSRFDDALEDLNRALDLDRDSVPALIERCRVQNERNQMEAAIGDGERALAIDAESIDALIARGAARCGIAKTDAVDLGLSDFERALELHPTSARALAGIASVKAGYGDAEGALASAERARDLDPDCIEALIQRSSMLVAERRVEEALGDVNRALRLQPHSAEAHAARGEAYVASQRWDLAEADFRRALELHPDNLRALMERGWMYMSQQQFERALSDFAHIVGVMPRSSVARVVRATAFLQLQRFDDALADLNAAFAGDAGVHRIGAGLASYARATVLLHQERPQEAVADLDVALAESPDSIDCLTLRTTALLHVGEYAAARRDAKRALKVDPESEDAQQNWTRFIGWLAAEDPDALLKGERKALEDGLEKNQALINGVNFENGLYKNQKKYLLETMTGTEELIWLCRCARPNDVLRQVALLITTEQLIWSRETAFGSQHGGFAPWGTVVKVDEITGGFSITTNNELEWAFNQLGKGVDFTGSSTDKLDGEQLREVVKALAKV